MALNAEDELVETEKSLQRDGHGELEIEDLPSLDEKPNFQRPEKSDDITALYWRLSSLAKL